MHPVRMQTKSKPQILNISRSAARFYFIGTLCFRSFPLFRNSRNIAKGCFPFLSALIHNRLTAGT